MNGFKALRKARRLSQRGLAARAGVSFRTIQLLESGGHDYRLSSVRKVSRALGLPAGAIERAVERRILREPDSVLEASERIRRGGKSGWTVPLFDFVDEFRRRPRPELVAEPPDPATPRRLLALLASTVETLCDEAGLRAPGWCGDVPPLPQPWFVSGVESLKAFAIVESPVPYRRRRIFVLDNFLSRS